MSREQAMPSLAENAPSVAVAATGNNKEVQKEKPEWLNVLLRTKFWKPCKQHRAENRAEGCMFCIHCHKVSCPHCTHDEPGHNRLKVRRYVYRSVVLATDMESLHIDVSLIQTYTLNQQKVLHLRPMKRSKLFRPQPGTPRCSTCKCFLHNKPNLFCSLVCEGKHDVSADDFSAPEAEERYRSLQANIVLQQRSSQQQPTEEPSEGEHEHVDVTITDDDDAPGPFDAPPEPEPEPAPAPLPVANEGHMENRSFRKRPRKQGEPMRAPFF